MSTASTAPMSGAAPVAVPAIATRAPEGSSDLGVQRKRWTRAEFLRLNDQGWFEDKQVELLDGTIIEMPPAGSDHWCSAEVLRGLLAAAFGDGFYARLEGALATGEHSQPVPDVAVVTGSVRDHFAGHPTTAVLVVEVSKTTQRYDMTTKADHYASVGIADYWVLDLEARELTVFRDPREHAESPFGWRYTQTTVLDESQSVSPLAQTGAELRVAEMLPPPQE